MDITGVLFSIISSMTANAMYDLVKKHLGEDDFNKLLEVSDNKDEFKKTLDGIDSKKISSLRKILIQNVETQTNFSENKIENVNIYTAYPEKEIKKIDDYYGNFLIEESISKIQNYEKEYDTLLEKAKENAIPKSIPFGVIALIISYFMFVHDTKHPFTIFISFAVTVGVMAIAYKEIKLLFINSDLQKNIKYFINKESVNKVQAQSIHVGLVENLKSGAFVPTNKYRYEKFIHDEVASMHKETSIEEEKSAGN